MTSVAIEQAGATRSPRAAWTVVACLLVAIVEGYDFQVIGLATPQIRAALHLSPEQVGWILSASLIGLTFGAVIGGWLADLFGRKPVLLGSVVTLGAFMCASAYAPDFQLLFLARLATGLGLGGVLPNLVALVSESVAKKHIATAVGIMFCGMPLGGIAVALLAKTEGVDWRMLFIAGGLLSVAAAPIVIFGLTETRKRADASRGARPNVLGAWFGGGLAASTLLLWLVFALTLLILSLVINWLPSIIIAKGYPPPKAFVAPLLFSVGSLFGAGLLGWLCDFIGVRIAMVVVYAGMTGSIYMIAQTRDLDLLYVLSFLAGFFILGAQFALYGVAPKLYSDAVRGVGVGGAVGIGRLGAIAGPVVAGLLMGAGGKSGDEVLMLTTPLPAAAGIAFLLLTFAARDRLRKGPSHGEPGHGLAAVHQAGDAA